MRITTLAIGVLLATTAAAQAPLSGQLPVSRSFSSRGGTQTVSAVAKATYMARAENNGVYLLDLLVIWRGTPGWFATSDGGSGGGSTGGTNVNNVTLSYGDVNLQLSLTYEPRTLTIQGMPVPLGTDNVVLVDGVDSAKGPSVVRTLRVDPAMNAERGPEMVYQVLKRSPEIIDFVKCGTALPDAQLQVSVDTICARIARQ